MKHQIGGTGWPSRNIHAFPAGLPKGAVRIPLKMGDCDLSLQAELQKPSR